jgi:hypothetical protein
MKRWRSVDPSPAPVHDAYEAHRELIAAGLASAPPGIAPLMSAIEAWVDRGEPLSAEAAAAAIALLGDAGARDAAEKLREGAPLLLRVMLSYAWARSGPLQRDRA